MFTQTTQTSQLQELQGVLVSLSLYLLHLGHGGSKQALLNPPPAGHVELEGHVGHLVVVLEVIVGLLFGTDVKIPGERGHRDDIAVFGEGDVV